MQYLLAAVISTVIAVGVWFVPHQAPQEQALTPHMQAAMREYVSQSLQSMTFGSTQPFAGNTYNLAGSGISGSATTITLTSLTLKQTSQPIVTADLVGSGGGTYYVTLEPGNNTRQEIVGCTGVSQSGTSASLTGCTRGLSPISPYTASSTLQFSHAGGSQVIFSDPPQLFAQYYALANVSTSTNTLVFSSTTPPRYDFTPGSFTATTLVDYATLSATAIQGAGTSTFSGFGIARLATSVQVGSSTASSTNLGGQPLVIPSKFATTTPGVQCNGGIWNCIPVAQVSGYIAQAWIDLTQAFTTSGAWIFNGQTTFNATSTVATSTVTGKTFGGNITNTFTAGQALTGLALPQPVGLGSTTPNVFVVDGDTASTTNFIGFAVNSVVAGGNAYVQTDGIVGGFSGLTVGGRYYVSDTIGVLSTTVGTFEVYVGTAVSATQIYIDRGPTSATQYVGSTAVSVSSGTTNYPQPAYARTALFSYTVSNSDQTYAAAGSNSVMRVGQTATNINSAAVTSGRGCSYSATWTGNAIAVAETGETTVTCSIAGTLYWYR